MVMSVTLTARQYVGSPLQCWVPAEFSKAWEQFRLVRDICAAFQLAVVATAAACAR